MALVSWQDRCIASCMNCWMRCLLWASWGSQAIRVKPSPRWSAEVVVCWFWQKGRCSAPRFCSVAHDAQGGGSTLAPAPSGVLVSEAPSGGVTPRCFGTDNSGKRTPVEETGAEEVHHLDEDKGNNKARNLAMVAARAHRQHHARGKEAKVGRSRRRVEYDFI